MILQNVPLHRRLTVVDGLIVSRWHRPVFEAMRDGGLSAANCTCSVWEDFPTTMKAMADWKQWIRENSDLLMQAYTTEDIRQAKETGKVGIILGWQNSTGFGDYLPLVDIYHEIGLRIVQLTYNTTNTVGSGCYESVDTGLTDFGRDLVDALNRVGIVIDLSHVGMKTARDAILYSKQPVTFSHCLPAALKQHPRNKSDEDIRLIAERGGFVGVTFFPPFLKRGTASTIDDFLDAVEHVINIAGENQTGIGTDFTQDHDESFFDYITRDKGYGRKLTSFGEIINPEGIRRIEHYPNLTEAMERRGWPEDRIERVMGENWIGYLRSVWGA